MYKIYKLYYLFFIIPIILVLFVLNTPKPKTITKVEYNDSKIIKVSIFGEVLKPGVYYMNSESTYMDLIERCGITDKTYIDNKYLNIKLKDGESYEVLINEINTKYELIINNSSINFEESKNELININKDKLEILVTLPSIGTVRANAIIEYRNVTKFKIKEDIMKVKGITQTIYDKIEDYITV